MCGVLVVFISAGICSDLEFCKNVGIESHFATEPRFTFGAFQFQEPDCQIVSDESFFGRSQLCCKTPTLI